MLEAKVIGVGLTLIVLMVIFLTLTSCANPIDAPPETRCFTTPYLYCSQLADWDGE